MSLAEHLDGAHLVIHDPATDLVFAWWGPTSRSVHAYDPATGDEVNVFTVGLGKPDPLTRADVEASVRERLAESLRDAA